MTQRDAATTVVLEVGTDIQTSSLDVLSRAIPSTEDAATALRRIVANGIPEVAVLSTCNRFELYAAAGDPEHALSVLRDEAQALLAWEPGSRVELVVRRDREAVRHLVSVAAGLESGLIGEHEILGQVRRAYAAGKDAGTVGTVLARLFDHALRHGREIRNRVGISGARRSLTDVAASWISAELPAAERVAAAVVGAGQTASQMAFHLTSRGVDELFILNRNPAAARALARACNARAFEIGELPRLLPELDVAVLATASSEPILSQSDVRDALARRSKGALLIVDLGLRPNVERAVGNHPSAKVLALGEVLELARATSNGAESWREQADDLLREAVDEFVSWQRSQAISPLLQELRSHVESIVLDEALRSLAREDAGSATDVRRFAARLSNRLLHSPTEGVREIAVRQSPRHAETVVERLFFRR